MSPQQEQAMDAALLEPEAELDRPDGVISLPSSMSSFISVESAVGAATSEEVDTGPDPIYYFFAGLDNLLIFCWPITQRKESVAFGLAGRDIGEALDEGAHDWDDDVIDKGELSHGGVF